MAQLGGATKPELTAFSRKASGLLRVAGAWDTFIFNIGLVSVGIAIALNQYYGPGLYGGASIWISTLLAGFGMLFAAATFYLWSVTFPRSGGVYIALSRSLSPAIAFVFTLVETMILCYYAALAASLIVTVGLSSFCAAVGAVAKNATLLGWAAALTSPDGIFWAGTLVLVLAGVLLASGTRFYFFVQKIMFVIAMLGTAVTVLVLLTGSRETFQANLTSLTSLNYDAVIDAAKKAGWAPAEFSWKMTIAFLVWPLLPLLGAVQSVGIGGEVKRVSRSQLFGMFGAVIAAAAMIALVAILADRTFGYDFQSAIAFNSLSAVVGGSTEASIGAAPWFTVLAGILTNSVLWTTLIMAGFVAWIWFWVPAELAYTTRTMIAWSFDRTAPEWLGYVSERLHTPVVAIGISTVVSVVFMWLIAYAKINLLTLIEVLLVIWGAAMVSAVLFPFTRPDLYRLSPAARVTFAGIPVMAITGLVTALFFLWTIVDLWNDPNAAGPLIAAGAIRLEFWITLGLVVFGIVWYAGIRAYRRSQGIDMDLAFKQIPIE
jgi:basic amino acid/polyamine antiporter, APA family